MNYKIKGPLECHANDIYEDLLSQRYTELSIRNLMYAVADLSQWLERNHLSLSKFTERETHRFLSERKRKFTGIVTIGSFSSILKYFWKMKLIPKWKQKKKVVTRLDRLINRYEKYLTLERGLAKNTIKLRKKEAYSFLLKAVGTQTNLKRLSPKIIRSYILSKDENGKKKGTAIQSVTCLRSLLRFLFIKNLIQVDLSLATPSIAGWNLRTLPRSLDPIIIEKIVSSCDFSNSSGYRDYAILLLLTQLGLRAGEVAGLRLDSICWREGVIFIAGKGNRTDSLPLPKKIGKTIATYLKDYRYQTKSRRIFLSERAPVGREINTACINRIVKKACKRAGVPEFATHQLRHTVATEILRKGGTLTEIAQVLRHSGVGTTAIYAKVDRVALQSIARKWPGGAK